LSSGLGTIPGETKSPQTAARYFEGIGHSFKNPTSTKMLVAKYVGAAAGAGMTVDGIRRLIKKSTAEKPISWQERVAGVGEAAIGGVTGYFSLTHGGKGFRR
jgi:hypothetical protein